MSVLKFMKIVKNVILLILGLAMLIGVMYFESVTVKGWEAADPSHPFRYIGTLFITTPIAFVAMVIVGMAVAKLSVKD